MGVLMKAMRMGDSLQEVFGTKKKPKWIKYRISIKNGIAPSPGPVRKFWEIPSISMEAGETELGGSRGPHLELPGLLLVAFSCRPEWVSGPCNTKRGQMMLDPMMSVYKLFVFHFLFHQGDDGIPGEPGLMGPKVCSALCPSNVCAWQHSIIES